MADKLQYSEEQIKKYLLGIYSGEIDEHNLPVDLYEVTAKFLTSGLYKGFGGDLVDFNGKDLALLNDLRENVYMFSAAKTYSQTFDQKQLLFNDDGELRSSREFLQVGAQNFEKFNDNWGLTERNTAIAQGRSASQWLEIQKNKDLLPYLVYQTIGEGLGCEICAPLDGLTAPVDDAIWDTLAIPEHWNCECIVIQEEKENVTETPKEDRDAMQEVAESKMQDVFLMNSGKDGYIFSPEHPYFTISEKDKAYASRNFDLPIPTMEEEIKNEKQ